MNPINIIFRIINPIESGMKNFTHHKFYNMFRSINKCEMLNFEDLEPCNLFRVVLHYKWGLPSLARFRIVKYTLTFFNNIANLFLPKRYWAYKIAILRKVD